MLTPPLLALHVKCEEHRLVETFFPKGGRAPKVAVGPPTDYGPTPQLLAPLSSEVKFSPTCTSTRSFLFLLLLLLLLSSSSIIFPNLILLIRA